MTPQKRVSRCQIPPGRVAAAPGVPAVRRGRGIAGDSSPDPGRPAEDLGGVRKWEASMSTYIIHIIIIIINIIQ